MALFTLGYWFITIPRPARVSLDFPLSIQVGNEIRVPLRINTRESMNAAEFYFSFPPDLLEVISIDQTGSFYQLWIKDYPRFNNEKGVVELAGGLPKPGFRGNDGLVATVIFHPKMSGDGQITMDETKSRLLANDGIGTKIESVFRPVTFRIR